MSGSAVSLLPAKAYSVRQDLRSIHKQHLSCPRATACLVGIESGSRFLGGAECLLLTPRKCGRSLRCPRWLADLRTRLDRPKRLELLLKNCMELQSSTGGR